MISAGENLLSERLLLLKIADRHGWGTVTEFTEVELARNEVEENKLKKIMKDSELKRAKAREVKLKGVRKPYYQVTGGYRADSPNNRKSGRQEDKLCFICRKPGHIQKDCRSRGAQTQGGGRGRDRDGDRGRGR